MHTISARVFVAGAIYRSAFLTAKWRHGASKEAAFLTGLNAGQTYGNIQTGTFLGGEIPGQLAAVTPLGL